MMMMNQMVAGLAQVFDNNNGPCALEDGVRMRSHAAA
jgi:hypothetical protein